MAFFESLLILLLLAILLLQVARRFSVPYPTMLAGTGVLVAMLPGAPSISLDPHLALALFVAPALLDAAFDLPPREVKRYWRPLIALAVVAVLLTAACVAWAGWAFAGLPVAAAVALGAIVAPPDAAAAAAILGQFALPRRTISVLRGESLLNDATALLLFVAAVAVAGTAQHGAALALRLVLAVPGGIVVGVVLARVYLLVSPQVAGTLGATILEFVSTFAVWVVADRLELSAILAVVAYAMVIARHAPARMRSRDRVHSYSVWEAAVFLMNVLAFLLMGLQVRSTVLRLDGPALARSLLFAAAVLAIVVVVRFAWVMLYNLAAQRSAMFRGDYAPPSLAQGLLVSWCGMRGLVTLATAFALPDNFPRRDLIVLTAFTVVLGTLVLQGLTLGPLIRWLKLPPDRSFDAELSIARTALIDTALADLAGKPGDDAEGVRSFYRSARRKAVDADEPEAVSNWDALWLEAIEAQRGRLLDMRATGDVDDDIYHALEEELDWNELAAAAGEQTSIEQG